MFTHLLQSIPALFALLFPAFLATHGDAQKPVVHAVLFFSPACSHCHKVMTEDLPPLARKYGPQLVVVEISVDTPAGLELYQAALARFHAEDRLGVPALFVGQTLLVGSRQIPENFPALIESGLAAGGTVWPDIPGLAAYLETHRPATPASWIDRYTRDPLGNSLAVLVLAAMLLSAGWLAFQFFRAAPPRTGRWPAGSVPLLALVGLGIAIYLSYVELTQVEAVCGPVGDCNAVQQSAYARLFGFLPVGILGALGYLSILAAWLFSQTRRRAGAAGSPLVIWGFCWAGLLFSIYLTFLEPFVIGATCAWCLSSAVIMTLLLWAAAGPAKISWDWLKAGRSPAIPLI